MGQKHSRKYKLSHEELGLLEASTPYTRQEIKEWHKGFLKDCPSGQLSKDGFRDVYATLFPGGDAGPFCQHVFRSFDKDGSGFIEFKEFLLAINVTSNKGSAQDKLDWAFSMYDIDGDGTVDQTEMLSIIQAIFNLLGPSDEDKDQSRKSPEERTAFIFQMMDVNKDGRLTKDEFITGCVKDKQLYQMLTADTNANTPAGGAE